MDNVIRQLACATMLQATKDFADRPRQRKTILDDLRSPWMQTFSQGTSMNVAEQLEKHPKEIIARIRKHEMEEEENEKSIISN